MKAVNFKCYTNKVGAIKLKSSNITGVWFEQTSAKLLAAEQINFIYRAL